MLYTIEMFFGRLINKQPMIFHTPTKTHERLIYHSYFIIEDQSCTSCLNPSTVQIATPARKLKEKAEVITTKKDIYKG